MLALIALIMLACKMMHSGTLGMVLTSLCRLLDRGLALGVNQYRSCPFHYPYIFQQPKVLTETTATGFAPEPEQKDRINVCNAFLFFLGFAHAPCNVSSRAVSQSDSGVALCCLGLGMGLSDSELRVLEAQETRRAHAELVVQRQSSQQAHCELSCHMFEADWSREFRRKAVHSEDPKIMSEAAAFSSCFSVAIAS